MASTSVSWSRFRLDTFGEPYLVWHNGPDYSTFDALWSADQGFVENALLDGLALRDPLAAQAIARLPLADPARERFVALLAGHIGQQPVGFHLRVAETLFRLTGDQSWSREVVRVLLGAGLWSDRFDAAIALASFAPTAQLIDALALCVQDPDYLVRYHAANTLLGYSGRDPDVTTSGDYFSRIRSRATAAEWLTAAEDLADAARAVLRC